MLDEENDKEKQVKDTIPSLKKKGKDLLHFVSPGVWEIKANKDFQVRVWSVTEVYLDLLLQIPWGYCVLAQPLSPFREFSRDPLVRLISFPDYVPLHPFSEVTLVGDPVYLSSENFQQIKLSMTRSTGFTSPREILEYKTGDVIARLLLIKLGDVIHSRVDDVEEENDVL